jgi:hypothetical protein
MSRFFSGFSVFRALLKVDILKGCGKENLNFFNLSYPRHRIKKSLIIKISHRSTDNGLEMEG